MTTPPPRNYGQMKPVKGNSADYIKHPYPTSPVYEPDRSGNYNSSDLDFAQLFTQLGTQDILNLHTRSDVDAHPYAQHHTLGTSRNQASPGDHIHDGGSSKLIGNGMALSISGAKGSNAALGSVIAMLKQIISFTDNTTT